MSKKILFILHNLYGGGAEKMMVRLANQFHKSGKNVEVVLLSDFGVNYNQLSKDIEVTCLYSPRVMSSIFKLVKLLYRKKYDVALSALTHVNVLSIIASALSFKLKRLFVSERNFFSQDRKVNNSIVMRAVYFIAPVLYRIIPNPVICVSQGVADDLRKNFNVPYSKLKTAPNPTLDDDFINQRIKFQENIHPLINDYNGFVVVAAGRLAYQKGFDILIEAFNLVIKDVSARLIIFGEGPLRASLELLIKDLGLEKNVFLPGFNTNLTSNIGSADLYVMSSRFEGSPNALVEAVATGVRVLSTDCPHGPREILNDDNLLVPVDSSERLAESIIRLLNKEKFSIEYKVLKFTNTSAANEYMRIFGF